MRTAFSMFMLEKYIQKIEHTWIYLKSDFFTYWNMKNILESILEYTGISKNILLATLKLLFRCSCPSLDVWKLNVFYYCKWPVFSCMRRHMRTEREIVNWFRKLASWWYYLCWFFQNNLVLKFNTSYTSRPNWPKCNNKYSPQPIKRH